MPDCLERSGLFLFTLHLQISGGNEGILLKVFFHNRNVEFGIRTQQMNYLYRVCAIATGKYVNNGSTIEYWGDLHGRNRIR